MNRFKCPACGGNQYTSADTAEGCIYCVYKGPLENMGPAGVEKAKQNKHFEVALEAMKEKLREAFWPEEVVKQELFL